MSMTQNLIEELRRYADEYDPNSGELSNRAVEGTERVLRNAAETIEQLSAKLTASDMNDGWIPVEVGLPTPEEEVLICAECRYTDGRRKPIITTAIYEDGTIPETQSRWSWMDIDGEWDDEEDCYIIPEGWWEERYYINDEEHNNPVGGFVLAWMPLPEPFEPKEG